MTCAIPGGQWSALHLYRHGGGCGLDQCGTRLLLDWHRGIEHLGQFGEQQAK
jgi:hypothetical protein